MNTCDNCEIPCRRRTRKGSYLLCRACYYLMSAAEHGGTLPPWMVRNAYRRMANGQRPMSGAPIKPRG